MLERGHRPLTPPRSSSIAASAIASACAAPPPRSRRPHADRCPGRCTPGRRGFGTPDGSAWTSAITRAAAYLGCEAPTPAADEVRRILPAITGDDLSWPLAYTLRQVRAWRDDIAIATAWAELAREVAARCEPDTRAGRLAHRYQLRTLDPLVSFRGQLTAEVIADMLGVAEADLLARVDGSADALVEETSGPLTVIIHAADELCAPVACPDDRLFRVDVSTRASYSGEVCEAMHRAWVSAGLSMHSESRSEVARMCREIQPWAMAPDVRWAPGSGYVPAVAPDRPADADRG